MAAMSGGQTPAYVKAFADWVEVQLQDKNVQQLIEYRQHSREGVQSHPFEDHLLPLFVAMGAAGADATANAFFRGISSYVIAMDGYTFS
jgi:4,5-DOPA dioxygenase extradiol